LAVRLLTEVRHDALHRAFQQLVDRHPVLRTALRWADGEPYQSVLPALDVDFTVEDARPLDDAAPTARLERADDGTPFALGEGPALPAPPEAAYLQLADRQRELLASPRGERLREYWTTELQGCDPVLELPADRPRPPVQSHRGDSVTFTLDADVTRRLRRRAEAEDTTLFVTLLSVFQLLVHRYTGEQDFLVGVPGSGRHDADLHRV